MHWWTQIHSNANGKKVHRSVETSHIHCDSLGYGWGAVLNEKLESRSFGGQANETHHITWKDVKGVRVACLPHLDGRRILLHVDTRAVFCVMADLTSRSPKRMEDELRRL
jgi:hypothetical protein